MLIKDQMREEMPEELEEPVEPVEEPPVDNEVAPPEAEGANEAADPMAGEAATDVEQDQYDRVTLAGIKLINESHAELLAELKKLASQPAQALATVVVQIIRQIDEAAGGKLPQVVILPAGLEIMGEVAQLAQDGKAFEITQNVAALAVQIMVKDVSEHFGVGQAEVQEFMQGFDVEGLKKQMQEPQQAEPIPQEPM